MLLLFKEKIYKIKKPENQKEIINKLYIIYMLRLKIQNINDIRKNFFQILFKNFKKENKEKNQLEKNNKIKNRKIINVKK